jgi:hypothetical protein
LTEKQLALKPKRSNTNPRANTVRGQDASFINSFIWEEKRMKKPKTNPNLERRKALANLEHRILAAETGIVLVSSGNDGQISFKRLDEFWPTKPNRKVTR